MDVNSFVSELIEELLCKVVGEPMNEPESNNIENKSIKDFDSEITQSVSSEFDEKSNQVEDKIEPTILNWESFFDFNEDFKPTLQQVYCKNSFADHNFLKGLKWSPCGNQLLASCNDNNMRTFNLFIDGSLDKSELEFTTKCYEGEEVYDFSWYPGSSIHNEATCCFATTSRGQPIHLWDPLCALLRCSYRPYNALDEMENAISLSFDPFGERIFCGFNNCVRVFRTCRPGRESELRPTYVKKEGQSGLISCFAFNQLQQNTYACGSYAKSVSICDDTTGRVVMVFTGHTGGITHMAFSNDGNRLYSGGRKDAEILCWDLRRPGHVLKSHRRNVITNQRIYFDLDPTGRYLLSGDNEGGLSLWDNSTFFADKNNVPPTTHQQAHHDTTNSVSFHPWYPMIASGSGQRHFTIPDSEDEDEDEIEIIDNSIKLWLINRN